MNLQSFKKFKLPDSPGVYFFLKEGAARRGGEILYIGKATSLKDRVKSYFGKDLIETRGPIILDMVFKADQIKFEKTDSVLEALILEAEYIKKHQPKYNTKEKSDKSFNYVVITKEEIPKVLIVRGKDLKQKHENYDRFTLPRVRGGTYTDPNFHISVSNTFGPYTNSSQLKTALQIIRKIFPFVDEASSKKANIEFYKQIHLTPASIEEYVRNIKNLKLFLHGKKKEIIRNLKKEMSVLAKVHKFEQANLVKKQIFALQHINDVALIKGQSFEIPRAALGEVCRIEAYDIAHMGGKNMVGVMTVVEDGEVNKSEYKKFKIKTINNTNDTGALKEVLERRFNHSEWAFPSFIVVDGGIAQINVVKAVVAKMKLDIDIVSVLKDDRHKPKAILGNKEIGIKYKREILLANSEAHRFAINYHKNMRNKNFAKNFLK